MRPDVNSCRDPDLLAAEVRRLQAVIAAGESARLSQKCDCPKQDNAARQDILTDEERALLTRIGSDTREWDKYSNGRPWFVTVQDAAIIRGLLERTK
jgi:hypothetical protein